MIYHPHWRITVGLKCMRMMRKGSDASCKNCDCKRSHESSSHENTKPFPLLRIMQISSLHTICNLSFHGFNISNIPIIMNFCPHKCIT